MNSLSSPASLDGGRAHYMRRERFEVNQYVRVQVSDTRFAIGVVTAIDEDHDKATVETRNGYDVTLPITALRRAFLVVLDLNGVLVARGRGSFILRPHVADFLKFVFSNFVVAVWTSGLQRSSNPIIDHVFGSQRDLLLFTLFRDACVPKASPENPYGTEKNLQVIFDRYPLSFHAVNTIIIDDSPDKCSHPDIALCPIPFKDPVAQHQDNGLLETMETLRQVLLLDSGAPLIIAAEERLHKLAEQHQHEEEQQREASQTAATTTTTPAGASAEQLHDARTPPSATTAAAASAGSASPASLEPSTAALHDHDTPADMQEVELWKTRLCCENLLGKCTRGTHCPFSHDADDGRPCSRKSHCQHHGSRWPKTSEEAAQEARKRQIREAKHQQYMQELERRQHEEQQHLQLHVRGGNGGGRGQPRRQADAFSPPQQQQRGGRQQQRGGRHGDSLEDDWASGPTGLSHTGDPAYDNMINEQQQQQQRRHTAPTVKATTAVYSDAHSAAFPTQRQSAHVSNAPTSFPTAAVVGGSAAGNLSSGYRRQLQHHNAGNGGYASQNASLSVQGQQGQQQQLQHLQQQQQQQGWSNQRETEVPLFFQSAPVTAPTTTTTIEPFSTRPIAQPTVAPSFSVASIKLASASPPTVSASGNSNNNRSGNYRGDARATSSSQQQQQQPQQAIRISGRQGDSNAVVNQLQALMRKN